MNTRKLIPYTLTFILVTLAFIPLIHIYEARSYYKIYKLTINQYRCIDTTYLEGFKDYLSHEVDLPRELFASNKDYHTYKLIKKFDALDITIFKIEGEHT